LTLPGVAAAHAHAGSTSPTLRGYNVLAHFLCAPPPPPPANVSASLPEVASDASVRERLEAHFSDDTCGACHRSMDGVGFAFEDLDWLGRSRREDAQGRAVDATASLSLLGMKLEVDGAVELASALSQHPAVAECVAKQWLRYASGVAETGDSRCLVQRMSTQIKQEDGLHEMLLAYLGSAWFRRGRAVP
jgi:mono/diheme cytochrome c family protein